MDCSRVILKARMPLDATSGLLLTSGASSIAAAMYFFRKRQTNRFKLAHLLAWSLGGAGLIQALMPTETDMLKELEKARSFEVSQIEDGREQSRLQLEYLKKIAQHKDG